MIFHVMDGGDLYQVEVSNLCITRIIRYVDGQPLRHETNYNDLSETVREKVLDRLEQVLRNGD